SCGNGVAGLVEPSTDHRAFLFAERFHSLAPFGDTAAFAEIFYTDSLERSLVACSFNLAQRLVAQLFERVHGCRYIVTSINREIESRFPSLDSRIKPLSFSISLCLPARSSLDR